MYRKTRGAMGVKNAMVFLRGILTSLDAITNRTKGNGLKKLRFVRKNH